MNRFKAFINTNVKALQAFHLMRQGAVILVAVLFANYQLGTDLIGNYEQLLYIGYTLSFFWVAGLIQGMLTSFPDYSDANKKVFIFNAYLVFSSLSLFLFLGAHLLKQNLIEVLTGKEALLYIDIFLFYLLINLPTYLVENIYLLKDNPGKIFQFGFLSFFGHIAVLMIPIWLNWDFKYSMYGLVLLAVIKHFWLVLLLRATADFQWNWPMVKQWYQLSFPLILYALLGGLMQSFDNWLVNFWYEGDSEQFAIFRYGARELPLTLALAAAFSSAMLPEIRKNLQNSLQAIKNKSIKLFHLLFPLSIVLVLSSQWWFVWVFTEAFVESIVIFNTYLLIIISRLVFSRTILVGLQDNKLVLYISLLEFFLNIILSFVFIRSFGLLGVAIATVIAYSIEKILLCLFLYYRYKIKVQSYTNLWWWSVYSVMLVFCYIAVSIEYFSLG